MPIIFPANCKGTTLGALREVKRDGYTTQSGGLFDMKLVKGMMRSSKGFFDKIEPGGVFMSNLEVTQKQIDETSEAISKSARSMVEMARESSKGLSEASSKVRDGTDKMGAALDKFMRVVDRKDFAETVKLTESLVDSLERLAVLEDRGVLDKVMKAMART